VIFASLTGTGDADGEAAAAEGEDDGEGEVTGVGAAVSQAARTNARAAMRGARFTRNEGTGSAPVSLYLKLQLPWRTIKV
jgi:hypothetical protein